MSEVETSSASERLKLDTADDSGEGSGVSDALQPFGWAGWLLDLPGSWRPLRIAGKYEQGSVHFGDAEGTGGRLNWSTVVRRRFDAEKVLRRGLRRAKVEEPYRVMAGAALNPLLYGVVESDEQERMHFAGYAAATRRVVQGTLVLPASCEDEAKVVLAALTDQPLDAVQKWSFFNTRFQAPAGYRYREAALTMGDMRVSFDGPDTAPYAQLHVRHVYPAALALGRGSMEEWLQREWKHDARDRREKRARVPAARDETTPLGPAKVATADRALRRGLLRRRHGTIRQICVVVHDETHQRLVIVRLTEEEERVRGVLKELWEGMYWG